MNIHPLVVHFPIALLLVYSLITLLPMKKWLPRVAWDDVATVLLVCGFAGAFMALQTGEIAAYLARPNRDLLEAHELFANATSWMYGLLIAGKVLVFVQTRSFFSKVPTFFQKGIASLGALLTHRTVVILLALFGLLALFLTGALGGIMVYGTTADPLAPLILNVLGIGM
jgi:uncharacterized membrane protein